MFQKGLKGIVAAETSVGHVDGEKGQLIYRGYDIREIMENSTFEQIAYLLWHGDFPNEQQLNDLTTALKENRNLPAYMIDLIKSLPKDMDIMNVLRTVISAEGRATYQWKPTIEQAIRLTAIAPTIIAYRKRFIEDKPLVDPDASLSHVENYLYMLNGTVPSRAHVNALEAYMILTMEHGMNASTFAARVTASTESDLVSAVTSAIGTMKGPLHGGAPAGVITLLNEVHDSGDIEGTLRKKVLAREKLMGFGHRVYKVHDPRSIALKAKLKQFAGDDEWLDLSMQVEDIGVKVLQELKPGRALYTNVEFYAAGIMKALNMSEELFTPTFSASRFVGWTAHAIEQSEDNVIFRPESRFVGTVRVGS
ncbi:citrate synthase/methylcitrate synthase [Bacillus sp. AGMB 02131]|uniref:Citrate synthase n=1 Tax=Peribacillus faecalis TaxID=2772559 RepID=A0A927CWQ9_9BACI|nr:citrate synthase/methylcitrate synthase [Peribacillus faecalis]MBD3109173.1 citrate synthase/methylcitrate synthase [Peribacillus faecalis]